MGMSRFRIANRSIPLALGLILMVRSPAAVAADVSVTAVSESEILPTPPNLLPVLAWCSVPEEFTSVERYRELADAGFTHGLIKVSGVAEAAKQLEVAKATGVKVIVACRELAGDQIEEVVQRFQDHPALGGYYVNDEPSAGDFETVATQVKRTQAVDDRRPCYVNLFPNYASTGKNGQLGTATYQEYVDRFVAEVPVPFVSFDNYPIVRKGETISVRPEWYENLEIITAAARKAGKPVWAFALSCPHGNYPMPTPAHLRVQVYSNLAYGAQVIQYFTYWTLGPRKPSQHATPIATAGQRTDTEEHWAHDPQNFRFHDAPIATDGKRTATYDLVQQMNRELQALRGVFLGAKVLSVGHTGETLPIGTRPYQPTAPVRQVTTNGQGAVVSHLSNAGRQFLVVVNRDVDEPMPLTVALDGTTPVHRVAKGGSLQRVLNAAVEARIEPGDIFVLTWPSNAKQ